jgi:hypothetical protein
MREESATGFEVRHRELREAGSTDGPWETSDVDGRRVQDVGRGNAVATVWSNEASDDRVRADARLIVFEHNTGALVDDLAVAVRVMLEWRTEGGRRQLDQPTQAVADRLAALDKASRP